MILNMYYYQLNAFSYRQVAESGKYEVVYLFLIQIKQKHI